MNAKNLAIILALLGAVSVLYNQTQNSTEATEFQSWKQKFGVKYESIFEEQYRERIFLQNLAAIKLHNAN